MRTKPTSPHRAKTKPERGLFWRKDLCVTPVWVVASEELEPVADSSAALANAVTVCLTPSEVVSYTDSEREGNEEVAESELLLGAVESISEADSDDVVLEDDDDEAVEEEEIEVLEVLDALEAELVLDTDVDDA